MDAPGYTQEQEAHEELKRYLISTEEMQRFPELQQELKERMDTTALNGLHYWNFNIPDSFGSFISPGDIFDADAVLDVYEVEHISVPCYLEGPAFNYYRQLLEGRGYEDNEGNFELPFPLFKRIYNLQAIVANVPDLVTVILQQDPDEDYVQVYAVLDEMTS